MERFGSLAEAAQLAMTRCTGWKFSTSDETYDPASLASIAETHDAENPADEDSFYLVSPEGAIGLAEDSDAAIDWLFLPLNTPGLDLPSTDKPSSSRFCSRCGAPTAPGARFCGRCGNKLA